MDKVCTGCGRFESDGPIGNTFLSCCPDSDYQEINVNMKDLIVFYKSQAKEIEGLREWKDKAIKLIEPSIEQSKGVLEDCDSEYWSDRANKIIDEGKNLLSQDTTQPDKGGE